MSIASLLRLGWYAATLSAQDSTPSLSALDLEGLLATPVTMVRRKEERLGRAAGAVYVITQEEIRRFGASSIPEALRLVPGLQVARIGLSTWAISARGFNNTAANKLLVMIDGRSVYSPILGGVYWDNQDTLIDDIDRIEVMRGPGAAMWGANAVTGVINIITKPAQRTQGTLVTIGTGSEDAAILRMRHGGAAGGRGYYRLYTQQSLRNGGATVDGQLGSANRNMIQGGFRGDWTLGEYDNFTVQGDLYRSSGRPAIIVPSLQLPHAAAMLDPTVAFGGNLLARWDHTHRSGALSTLQTYFDHMQRDALSGHFAVRTGDFEYQYQHPAIGRQELSLGLGSRFISDHSARSLLTNFAPADRNYNLQHLTLQDDINLIADRLIFTAAVRLERNTFTGWTAQPTFRLLYAWKKNHTLWGAWSRSVRTPSRGEQDFDVLGRVDATSTLPVALFVHPAKSLGNEVGLSAEVGYRGQLHRRVTLDTNCFQSTISNLINVLPSGQPELRFSGATTYLLQSMVYSHVGHVHSYGWETTVRWAIHTRFQLSSSYTWLRFSPAQEGSALERYLAEVLTNYPSHQTYVRGEWRPRQRWELDTTYFFYGSRRYDPQPVRRERLDLRIGWRATEKVDISAGAKALTPGNRIELFSSVGKANAPVSPSVYLRLGFRF